MHLLVDNESDIYECLKCHYVDTFNTKFVVNDVSEKFISVSNTDESVGR